MLSTSNAYITCVNIYVSYIYFIPMCLICVCCDSFIDSGLQIHYHDHKFNSRTSIWYDKLQRCQYFEWKPKYNSGLCKWRSLLLAWSILRRSFSVMYNGLSDYELKQPSYYLWMGDLTRATKPSNKPLAILQYWSSITQTMVHVSRLTLEDVYCIEIAAPTVYSNPFNPVCMGPIFTCYFEIHPFKISLFNIYICKT